MIICDKWIVILWTANYATMQFPGIIGTATYFGWGQCTKNGDMP
jgi:hypothetical protein